VVAAEVTRRSLIFHESPGLPSVATADCVVTVEIKTKWGLSFFGATTRNSAPKIALSALN
jgi:hypothetical protein